MSRWWPSSPRPGRGPVGASVAEEGSPQAGALDLGSAEASDAGPTSRGVQGPEEDRHDPAPGQPSGGRDPPGTRCPLRHSGLGTWTGTPVPALRSGPDPHGRWRRRRRASGDLGVSSTGTWKFTWCRRPDPRRPVGSDCAGAGYGLMVVLSGEGQEASFPSSRGPTGLGLSVPTPPFLPSPGSPR